MRYGLPTVLDAFDPPETTTASATRSSSWRRNVIGLVWLYALVSGLPACASPLKYSAEPIEATVIDAETKQPLEGVVVAANWQLEQGTVGGNIQAGQLMVMEAVTDKAGKFSFPDWGPKTTRNSFLVNDDPQLLLFKRGYEYRRLNNPYTSDRELRLRPVRRSEWNGKTIPLRPFKGEQEEYAEHIYRLGSDMDSMLDFARGNEDCYWKRTPRMLAALHKMSLHFENQGTKLKGWRLGQRIIRIDDIPRSAKCGPVEEFFRSYLQ